MKAEDAKTIIINHLGKHGFATFADYFRDIDFVIAEFYKGSYCPTAFMCQDENLICINPGWFEVANPMNDREVNEALDKISVLVRHELLHFLLEHETNFIAHLKNKYPNSWGRKYANPEMHTIANFAMDYDVCNWGYDPEDKKIIDTLTLNGEFIGGLITEEQVQNDSTSIWFDDGTRETFSGSQFNNWEHTKMEDMFQMLSDAHDIYTKKDPKNFGNLNKPNPSDPKVDDTKDDEYKAMFNKIIAKVGNGQASIAELEELYGRILAGEDIDFDTWNFKYSEGLKGRN